MRKSIQPLAEPPRKQPFPHQSEALTSIVRGFLAEKRLTAVMACGTGKTLVALWTAEKLQARRILVLVPSLALVQQTLKEWRRETSWKDADYLCVCSDLTVGASGDALTFEASDIPCQVTTKAGDVAAFLRVRRPGVKVVLSTYQSADVVARGARGLPLFDLGVFDEAHKTAGRKGKAFALALDDRHLSIRRRIFMTATPRHYRLAGGKDGEQLAYSMDDSKVYGPVVYKLPFGEAAKRRIICPYKVVICEVTRQEIDQELIRSSKVMVDGFAVSAFHVAGQIALKKALGKFGANKAITFHESVAAAERFTRDGSWGIKSHLPGYEAFHVNGLVKAGERAEILSAFTRSRKAIVSNARCLTEGVDIPAVDMVGFFCPKRSVVEVTQATGRAMRRAPGKRTGYILLPVIVDYGKAGSVEEAIGQANYGHVWEILQALREQDGALADILTELRREKGRSGKLSVPDPTFGGRVEVIGGQLSLKALTRSIAARCVELLTSSWEEMFERLKVFHEKHGHCHVIIGSGSLGRWVSSQRSIGNRGQLAIDRERRLSDLGFIWDVNSAVWAMRFEQLRAFREKNGHCNVAAESGELGQWCVTQRACNRLLRPLPADRKRRLSALGFIWDISGSLWEKMFEQLKAFREKNGNCNVSVTTGKLGRWVHTQRGYKRQGRLTTDHELRLSDLGFTWDMSVSFWEKMFERLKVFHKKNGHCNVTPKKGGGLGRWVCHQRDRRKQGRLTADHERRLSALGFTWDPATSSWDMMFRQLQAFRSKYGHCIVPQRSGQFGRWVRTQWQRFKRGRLEVGRERRLSSLGFFKDPNAILWEKNYKALTKFQQRFGHCNVGGGPLASWVWRQRRLKRAQRLKLERITLLNEIDFQWREVKTQIWHRRYKELEKFYSKNGHCRVPVALTTIFRWMVTQRVRRKAGRLPSERVKLLDAIGFVWNPPMGRR